MPLVLEVSCDVPFDLYPGRCEGFEEYISLKELICYDYRHPPDLRRMYVDGQTSVRENPPWRLRYGLRVDDGPLMLEYCLRTLSICYPLVSDSHNPLPTSQRLAGVDQPPPTTPEEEANFRLPEIRNISPRLRLQGLACYAHINFYSCWTNPARTLSFHGVVHSCSAMFNACSAANICVGLGFMPPATLRIAAWLATTEARFGVDVRRTGDFKELRSLWNAHNSYISRLQVKETARLKRVAKAPHLYRCANIGCQIQAINKSALLKCGGPCPAERKPRYCDRQCQHLVRLAHDLAVLFPEPPHQHWYIHREFCKPDNTSDYTDIIDDDGDPAWVDVADSEFRPPRTRGVPPWGWDWPLFAEREGPEIFIDIPNDSPFRRGEVVRLKTRTLSAHCLKAYRVLWAPPKGRDKSRAARTYTESLMTRPPVNMGFPGPPRDPNSMSILEPW